MVYVVSFVDVAASSEIPAGKGRLFEVRGKKIALFNKGGEFFAIDHKCPHKGGPLEDGALDGYCVVCPWHGWTFDLRTGNHKTFPNIKVSAYRVKEEKGRILVEA